MTYATLASHPAPSRQERVRYDLRGLLSGAVTRGRLVLSPPPFSASVDVMTGAQAALLDLEAEVPCSGRIWGVSFGFSPVTANSILSTRDVQWPLALSRPTLRAHFLLSR